MRTLEAATLAFLACPEDRQPLVAEPDLAGVEILRCRSCGRGYPVEDGIPRLLPEEFRRARTGQDRAAVNPALAHQVAESRARDEESTAYDAIYPDEEYRHELATYVRLLDPAPGDVVLDVGAGTGRVLKEYAARCRLVVAADFSPASLRFLRAREELRHAAVLAVEADGTHLPFADQSFDRVAALSVVCFLPAAEQRERLLREIHRVTRPGGTVVVSTYHYAPVKRLWARFGRTEGALKEGTHSGGRIWYRNDTRAEFVAALSRDFAVREIRGVCHRVPVLSNLSPGAARWLDGRLGSLSWLSPVFATELVARCHRP